MCVRARLLLCGYALQNAIVQFSRNQLGVRPGLKVVQIWPITRSHGVLLRWITIAYAGSSHILVTSKSCWPFLLLSASLRPDEAVRIHPGVHIEIQLVLMAD